ncbi:hypothetical protein JL721_4269 [Aureococcus anophagefferens]|nr:hypothetical protein JL721_4269 [Aureococcus anophagefferens]
MVRQRKGRAKAPPSATSSAAKPPPPPRKHVTADACAPLVIGAAFLVLYWRTASPSVGGGDSGELLSEACVGGVAHPPGYGLYPRRWPPRWEYATHAEVFALNNALVGLGLWRPDVEHCSLQLLPYPWFARQKRAYGNMSWPDVPPRPSTDVAADAYEVMLSDTITANLGGFPGGVYVDLHGVYEPRIGSTCSGDVGALGRPPAAARFRRGTWEHAARSAYNDAHYQLGLFCLTAAQELRQGLEAPRFPNYLRLLRNACVLISQAADDAGALSSPERDVVKNAALAAVSLHGPSRPAAASRALRRRRPRPAGRRRARRRRRDASARRGVPRAHGAGDPDAAVFEDFLRKVAPRPGA